jgi:hypothetical protein
LQQSGNSDREKKRTRLGSGAAVVCSSTALKGGGVYRLGRERELGFPEVAGAGKLSGRGGSAADARSRGRLRQVRRLLRMHCGTLADLGNG